MAVGVKLHDELNYGMKECPAAEPVSQSIDIQAGVTMEKKDLHKTCRNGKVAGNNLFLK